MNNWPKLSETLKQPKNPGMCLSCGAPGADVWQECDESDNPTLVFFCLCAKCSSRIIEPHPRLYIQQRQHAPMPGIMPTCLTCVFREGYKCNHKNLKANGGPGLLLNFPPPVRGFVDGARGGHRWGGLMLIYRAPVTCKEKADGIFKCYGCNAERPMILGTDPTTSTGCCPGCGEKKWEILDHERNKVE